MASGNGVAKATKKPQTAMERLEQIERSLMQQSMILQSFQQTLNKGFERIDTCSELLDILSELLVEAKTLTKEQINARFSERRLKRLQEQLDKQTEEVAKLVAAGTLVAVDSVEDNNLVVATEYDESGSKLAPGKLYGWSNQFVPAVKEALVGKKVMDVVEAPGGHKLEILEIYKIEKPVPAPVELQTAEEFLKKEKEKQADSAAVAPESKAEEASTEVEPNA